VVHCPADPQIVGVLWLVNFAPTARADIQWRHFMKTDGDLLYIITSSGIGEGEADLGARLAEGFFKVLAQSDLVPAKIIFMNAGIFLTTQGSPVENYLRELEKRGTQIVSCTTCLHYFERFDRLLVGKPGDMKETVSSLSIYNKVVTF